MLCDHMLFTALLGNFNYSYKEPGVRDLPSAL